VPTLVLLIGGGFRASFVLDGRGRRDLSDDAGPSGLDGPAGAEPEGRYRRGQQRRPTPRLPRSGGGSGEEGASVPATPAWCERDPSTGEILIGGRLRRADLAGFCERVCGLLADCADDPVVCDVGAIVAPDAVTVDAMARLKLGAGRLGRSVVLRRASPELASLLGLMGLRDVVRLLALPLEPERQPEQREQVLHVEEERHLHDPAL
jgi:STAS domain